MPRPKSEITKQSTLTIRLTNKQKEFVNDMGGSQWLRNYIDRQIRSEEIQLGISSCTETQTYSNSQKTNPVYSKP